MYGFNVKVAVVAAAMTVAATTATAEEFVVGQHNKTFVMKDQKVEKLTVKVGDTIQFQNQDPWFHNVFSLSDTKTFDLGSYPQGQSKAVTFDKPGEVEVECAIHPVMLMKVEVK